MPYASHTTRAAPTASVTGWAQTVAALTEQLAVKDGQIASLGRALEFSAGDGKSRPGAPRGERPGEGVGERRGERGPSLAVALEQRVTPSTQNSIETMAGNLPGHRFIGRASRSLRRRSC